MKKWLSSLLLAIVCTAAFGLTDTVQAEVVNESQAAVRAHSDYESKYKLKVSYKGTSGVTFKSYSPIWNTTEKLKALEQELLKNKHGKELAYLGEVAIFPDYPGGDGVQGLYYAQYAYSKGKYDYMNGRKIHLFGGNEHNTVKSLAYTLSHEYGHHFSYYQLVQKEQLDVDDWLQSDYAKARGYAANKKVHTGGGDYLWDMAELMAEDYVQLFGSETAISQYMQMNTDISNPFETPAAMTYWSKHLGGEYKRMQPLKLYLTDYKKHTLRDGIGYDLELTLASKPTGKVYVLGEGSSQQYVSALMGEWPALSQSYWIKQGNRPFEVSGFMLHSRNPAIKLQALQHQAKGFNKGSGFLNVAYKTIPAAVTDKQTIIGGEVKEAKAVITQVADEKGIPAEVLKAIAFEKSGMKQHKEDGTVVTTADGGFGMMGINPAAEGWKDQKLNADKLKTDMQYNVEAAADYLLKHWDNSFLPMANNHEEQVVEDWYFALLAYDGVKKANIPAAGTSPFQEKVFSIIRNNSKLPLGSTPEIEYKTSPSNPDKIELVPNRYEWPTAHLSTQHYRAGLSVYTKADTAIEASIGGKKQQVPAYTPFLLEETAETNDPAVHYLYYKAKGNNVNGYLPSHSLSHSETVSFFRDITSGETARAVAYLQEREIINGYEDGTYRPNQQLYRRHAAKLLVQALDLQLPPGYKMKADDMKPGDLGYEVMAIAEAHGLMGQGSDMRPNDYLSRNQMAAILDRAFGSKLAAPTTEASISDVPKDFWNYKAINKLAYNKITVANPFRLYDKVSRSQFALFLERTLKITEK